MAESQRPPGSSSSWSRVGALPAAFAGLLHPAVTQVTLKNALGSYLEVAQTEDYRWPYAVMLAKCAREI